MVIIGASLSEPHTDGENGDFLWIYVCISVLYVFPYNLTLLQHFICHTIFIATWVWTRRHRTDGHNYKKSSESAETWANRLQHQREREKSLCASKTVEESEERLRKRRMSQAGCSDCRAERGKAMYRGCIPVNTRDVLLRAEVTGDAYQPNPETCCWHCTVKSGESQGYRGCVPVKYIS